MKKLLIVPGGGDPQIKEYEVAYELLTNCNDKLKIFDEIETVPLLGHKTYNAIHKKITFWNCVESTDVLLEKLMNVDNDKNIDSFDIFARSGGCFVALMTLNKYQPLKLNRIICWGPATHQWIKSLFLDKFEESEKVCALDKGLLINRETYNSFVPFEKLVLEYNQRYKLIIGHGDCDKYSNWVFGEFLEDIINKHHISNVIINKIHGGHVIKIGELGYEDYVKMIFEL